jgi:predicted RNA-binding Zn ribbon-like protein
VAQPISAAPGQLELVRRFVNTRDIETGEDGLRNAADLTGWLRNAGLLDDAALRVAQSPGVGDHERAVEVREALRALLLANHDGSPAPTTAVSILNDAARRAGLSLSFVTVGEWTATSTAAGIDQAIGALLVIVVNAMAAGRWRRLKACANDDCQWAFYDRSRARSAKWCSMGVCGNRMKQRAWRIKHAAG